MEDQRYIVFLGKVGHGKTRLLNELTDSKYVSSAAASSCTRRLQLGCIPRTNIVVVDTPGFYSSEDVAGHTKTQMEAFRRPVSGLYIVVRFGAPAEMAEVANRMMDFTGDEDVRVICTHVDTVETEIGFDGDEMALELSTLLDIPKEHIAMVGKNTNIFAVKSFIMDTIHKARRINVSAVQRVAAASLSVGSRKFNQEIDELLSTLNEASRALDDTDALSNGQLKTFVRTFVIRKAESTFTERCNELLARAKELLPKDEMTVSGKVDKLRAAALKEFKEKYKLASSRDTETDDGQEDRYRSENDSRGRQGRSRRRAGREYTRGASGDGLYERGCGRDSGKQRSGYWRDIEGSSQQPKNQKTKDLESSLYSFLLAQCGASTKNQEVPANAFALDKPNITSISLVNDNTNSENEMSNGSIVVSSQMSRASSLTPKYVGSSPGREQRAKTSSPVLAGYPDIEKTFVNDCPVWIYPWTFGMGDIVCNCYSGECKEESRPVCPHAAFDFCEV